MGNTNARAHSDPLSIAMNNPFFIKHKQPLSLSSRITAAIFGGYWVAASFCALLANILPMSALDATLCATMLSFAIYVLVAIRVFCVSRARRAWAEVIAISFSFAGLSLLVSPY